MLIKEEHEIVVHRLGIEPINRSQKLLLRGDMGSVCLCIAQASFLSSETPPPHLKMAGQLIPEVRVVLIFKWLPTCVQDE